MKLYILYEAVGRARNTYSEKANSGSEGPMKTATWKESYMGVGFIQGRMLGRALEMAGRTRFIQPSPHSRERQRIVRQLDNGHDA